MQFQGYVLVATTKQSMKVRRERGRVFWLMVHKNASHQQRGRPGGGRQRQLGTERVSIRKQ